MKRIKKIFAIGRVDFGRKPSPSIYEKYVR